MKEISTTITQRGQVTIPAEVRRLLGAKPRDRIVFRIDGTSVSLVPAPFSLESAYGSVTPQQKPENFEEISRIAREDKVARISSTTRRS